LIELWARHLFETIRPNSQPGFSRFNLWWKQKACSVSIVGEGVGLNRLRKWIFGNRQSTNQGYMQIADKNLLTAVASTHCKLVLANQTSEAIDVTAKTSTNRKDFEAQLMRLSEDIIKQ